MKTTVACGSAILLFAIHVAAQTAAPPPQKARAAGGTQIVTTGCVNRAQHNGSLAGAPGVPPSSPSTAGTLANSAEPTSAFLLNGATMPLRGDGSAPSADAVAKQPMSYVLDGASAELERHLGHQVEVTGALRIAEEGAPGTKTSVGHIRVASIKTIAAACRKPADQQR
jgi:hypothetical protein